PWPRSARVPHPSPTRRSSDLVVPGMPGLAFATTATALLTGALVLAARAARLRPSRTEAPPHLQVRLHPTVVDDPRGLEDALVELDRKSTRLNSSHVKISYAVF